MSTGNEKRQRKRATRVRKASRPSAAEATSRAVSDSSDDILAREHYRREKARRAERHRPPEHPLEQARRAYEALLAADAERAKGGRPRKEPKAKAATPSADPEPTEAEE
jgi:hypothetical protein